MFNKLSSIYKLSLCLLLSAGVHGGLVFYNWVPSPAESRLVHAPVVVSLLPAIDIALPALEEQPQTPLETVSSSTTSRVVAARQSIVDRRRPPPSAPPTLATKALPGKPLSAAVEDEPKTKIAAAGMVCLTPQEVVHEKPPELFAESQSEAALTWADTATDNVPTEKLQASLHTADKGLLNSAPVSVAQSLIEVVPNYRNNPLPKYPYLARQKHWEGVVWLLVDVSREGLVDGLKVEQSCGHRVLDRAASRAVRRWQFSPASRAGLKIKSQVRIPIRFLLKDG